MGEGDFFAALLDRLPHGVQVNDTEGRITYSNRAHHRMLGWAQGELVGRRIWDVQPSPEEAERLRRDLERLVREQPPPMPYRTRSVRRDGTVLDLQVDWTYQRDGEGRLVGFISVITDITARRREEQELQESRERLRAIVETTSEWIWEADTAGRYTSSNPALERILGWRPEEMQGRSAEEYVHEEDRAQLTAQMTRLAAQKRGWNGSVLRWRHRDGTYRWLQSRAVPILGDSGEVLGCRGSDRDVTAQRVTEEELRLALAAAAEERGRAEAVVAALGDGISIQDRSFRVLYQNEAHRRLMGDHVGEYCYVAYGRSAAVCADCPLERCFEDGLVHVVARSASRADGTVSVEVAVSPLRDASGNIVAGIEAVRDITPRVRAEQALRESEERFREMADSLPVGVFECDLQGRFTYANRTATALFGHEEEDLRRGLTITDALVPEEHERARRVFAERARGAGGAEEYQARRRDGSIFPMLVTSRPIVRGGRLAGVRGVAVDLSERKRLEAEMLKAEKLASIGVLAGGIAHDFNNILTAVLGNVSLAKLRLPGGSQVLPRLEEAEKATLQARDLTQQLLTFARGGAPVKKVVDLTPVVREGARFVLRGSKARLELDLPEDLWPVEADEGQVRQVVHNLVINAAQAMPQGGTVRVGGGNILVGVADAGTLAPGRYVRVTVSDEGSGIPQEHLGRIFDPYFTTKEKGSGLGLAIAYSVVRSHGGQIEVASREGEGTTFTVHLPASERRARRRPPEQETVPRGTGRILVMDDEEPVRETLGAILREIGYEAVTAQDGREAVARFRDARESGRPFDLVILDLTVPGGMGGREALDELRAVDPAVRAVVSSGYSNDPVLADCRRYGFRAAVVKPYRVRDLARILQRALAER